MKVSKVSMITKIVVDILFCLGVVAVFFIPLFVSWWIDFMGYSKSITLVFNGVLVTSGIVAIYILWQVKCILKSVVMNDVFSDKTVISLRRMAICCFIIGLIFLIKLFFLFGIGTVLIAFVFFLATLIFLTLKDVFKAANLIKSENDWTV